MSATTPCPDGATLRRLLLGRIPPSDGEPLYEHLDECERCAEVARSCDAGDWLADALRGAADGDALADASLAGLVHTLRRMGPPAAEPGEVGPPTVLSDTIPPAGEAADTNRDLFDFLAPPESPGELGRLGEYRILKVLGSGGMGVVFHAEDPALERPVALKAMRPGLAVSESARRRFLREARAAAALHHDHIVPIFRVGEDRGVPFLAMPLLRGESLEDRLKREGALPPREVFRIGREIALGLEAAHARGLVHRDIKPANVWLETVQGEPGGSCPRHRVKILDFGLARPAADAKVTQEGAIVGTPAYMAPEQAGGKAVDARSDLFSLGCVLYRMATGEAPFEGSDAVAVLLAVAGREPRPPGKVNRNVPPALSALIMRLLAKDPAGRPASAGVVIERLARAEAAPRKARWGRRWALLAAAAVLVLGAAAAIGFHVAVRTNRGGAAVEATAPPEAAADRIREVRRFEGSDGRVVEGVAVSPDGLQVLVSTHVGGGNRYLLDPGNNLRLYELATGRKTATLEGSAQALAVALSPDGKTVFSGGVRKVKTWDFSRGEVASEWTTEGQSEGIGEVLSVAFTPDGKHAFSASCNGGEVLKWDLATGRSVALFRNATIPSMALSADGRRLAFITQPPPGDDDRIRVYDATTAEELRVIPTTTTSFGGVCITPDGRRVAWGHADGTIRVWDVEADREMMRLPFPKGEIQALAFAPDGKRLLATTSAGFMRLWDARTGDRLDDCTAPSGVRVLAFTPDGQHVVTGNYDGIARLYRLPDPAPDKAAARHFDWPDNPHVYATAFSPDGRYLMAVGDSRAIRIWDVATGSLVHEISRPADDVWFTGAVFSPDGKQVLGGKYNGRVYLFDAATGEEVRQFTGHAGAVWILRFSPDGRLAVATGDDKTNRVWDVETGQELHRERSPDVQGPAYFVADGRRVVTGGKGGALRLWDARSGEDVRTFESHGAKVACVLRVLADGHRFVSYGDAGDPTLREWDADTGEQVHQLSVGADVADGMAVDARGRRVLLDDRDALRVRDLPTGDLVWEAKTPTASPRGESLSPDGRFAGVGSVGDGVYLLRLPDPPAAPDQR